MRGFLQIVVNFGALEGELPLAAHSLHDVVMRQVPQVRHLATYVYEDQCRVAIYVLTISDECQQYFVFSSKNNLIA